MIKVRGGLELDSKKIERINYLARKSKASSLTDEEKAEQAELRLEYLAAVRRNFRAQLDSIRYAEDSVKPLN